MGAEAERPDVRAVRRADRSESPPATEEVALMTELLDDRRHVSGSGRRRRHPLRRGRRGLRQDAALVGRVTTLVLRDGVPLRADRGGHLHREGRRRARDRLRVTFEKARTAATAPTVAGRGPRRPGRRRDRDTAFVRPAHPHRAPDRGRAAAAASRYWTRSARRSPSRSAGPSCAARCSTTTRSREPCCSAWPSAVKLKRLRSLARAVRQRLGPDRRARAGRSAAELIATPDLTGLIAAAALIWGPRRSARDPTDGCCEGAAGLASWADCRAARRTRRRCRASESPRV